MTMNLIPEDLAESPGYKAASPHFLQNISQYHNPRKRRGGGEWMRFLAQWRRSHPKPHSLREGAALVKAAGMAYRSRRNPELTFGDESLPGWDIGQTAPTGSDAIMLANPKRNWWVPGYAVAVLIGLSFFQNMKR